MSAAFSIGDSVWWCSNGLMRDYLERMQFAASASPDAYDRLLPWLNQWRECFFIGAVIPLDEILNDSETVSHFIMLLDQITAALLESGKLSESGKQWLQEHNPKLKSDTLAIRGT